MFHKMSHFFIFLGFITISNHHIADAAVILGHVTEGPIANTTTGNMAKKSTGNTTEETLRTTTEMTTGNTTGNSTDDGLGVLFHKVLPELKNPFRILYERGNFIVRIILNSTRFGRELIKPIPRVPALVVERLINITEPLVNYTLTVVLPVLNNYVFPLVGPAILATPLSPAWAVFRSGWTGFNVALKGFLIFIQAVRKYIHRAMRGYFTRHQKFYTNIINQLLSSFPKTTQDIIQKLDEIDELFSMSFKWEVIPFVHYLQAKVGAPLFDTFLQSSPVASVWGVTKGIWKFVGPQVKFVFKNFSKEIISTVGLISHSLLKIIKFLPFSHFIQNAVDRILDIIGAYLNLHD
ncbi:uncharacterized protein [Periplaneta americana]|uniref:uncharacterized protein n=1 Tax=Periplaneta americana TaxID=6978 RepID=UPI0037E8114E